MKPEKFTIMPWLFLVKINKEEQKQFKEKVSKNSPFFMPIAQIYNARNMECGEIVQIGEAVRGTDDYSVYQKGEGIYGWEKCEVGMTLIFHHTIEQHVTSKDAQAQYWVFEDEEFNYYAVDFINLRGFYDGKTITPHPNFVFLKNVPCFESDGKVDSETGHKLKKSNGGLLLFSDWENSFDNISQKSEKIKEHIESLAKTKNRTPEIQLTMEQMEQERIDMNRKAQKRMFLPYRVAYSNRIVDRNFGRKVLEDDVLFCFNKACLYISNFQDKEYSYIVALVEHIGGLLINKKIKPSGL